MLRFLQIWILPDGKGHKPNYGDYRFKFEDRVNKWLPIATYVDNTESEVPIRIHQDINAYTTVLKDGTSLDFAVSKGRQAYLVRIEGDAEINGVNLTQRDGLEIVEEDISITPKNSAHILVIEMAKSAA